MLEPPMTYRVLINAAILRRGSSGTARGVTLIREALQSAGHDVALAEPPWSNGNKLQNGFRAAYWDLHHFGAASPADLYVSPTNVGRVPKGSPHLLWVHDTMVLDHPQWFDRAYALHARATFGISITAASAVITPSAASRDNILRRWPRVQGRLHVVPWPTTGPTAAQRLALPQSRPTVLMLGATEAHKRHLLGIKSVEVLRNRTGLDIALRIVGPGGRAEGALARAVRQADPKHAWISRELLSSHAEVTKALDEAWVLIQCSLDEGFCLPLLESASRGLPAVHTGAGAMREVHPYGDVGSDDPVQLATHLEALLNTASYAQASLEALKVANAHSPANFQQTLQSLVRQVCDARSDSSRK